MSDFIPDEKMYDIRRTEAVIITAQGLRRAARSAHSDDLRVKTMSSFMDY